MKQKKTQNTDNTPKSNFRPKKQPTRQKRSNTLKEPKTQIFTEVESTAAAMAVETPTPVYEVPQEHAPDKKPLNFSRLVANDAILVALEKASYTIPSDIIFDVLPATLRGSDTVVFTPKQPDSFLISTVPAVSRLLATEETENRVQGNPSILFLFPSEESAKAAQVVTTEVFGEFKLTDILFTTPQGAIEAEKNNQLNLKEIVLLGIHELNLFEISDKANLELCMASLVNEKVQKIFISYQNSPKIREFAFKYLENPEIFSFLPSAITNQYPRQFAHALEATKKFQVLLGYLKTYKPRAALVVANTKTVAEWIAFKLHGNNIKISLLTDPISPYENRAKFLSAVSNGEINVFVATDYALKNFAVENLNCIYNFDLPDNPNLYLERLNKILGSRNPISIAFVCEDYGFNMGKIEEKLGFKIRVTTPDKNFFQFKDASDYPLESSGRVKAIGQKVEEPQPVLQQVKPKEPRVDNRAVLQPQQQNQNTQKTTARHHQPDTSKFVRRDERAREVVADAVLAARMAEEKRKTQNKETHSNTQASKKEEGFISSVFFVVSEAFLAGVHATKESLSHNTEQRFPALHRLLNRTKKK